jgi:type III secretion protein D
MTGAGAGIAELRILSGPHLGAAVPVGPGRYVFGSDDGCDFILSGAAPRHLSLTVSEEGGEIRVLAKPEAAGVALSGAPLAAEGESVPPGAPLGLGFTALAWRPRGQAWEPVTLVPLEYQPAPPEGVEPEADGRDGEPPEVDPGPAPAAPEAGEPAESRSAAPGATKRPLKFWIGLVVLLLLISPLFYGFWRSGAGDSGEIGRIQNILATHGFQDLAVEYGGDAVLISGPLPNDQEVARLVSLVREQPAKVYLKVSVTDDRLKAVRDALRAHGFYPRVDQGDAGLSVAAYMKDGLVEAKAFGYVDMDAGDVPVSRRHIVYEPQLKAALSEEMGRAGLPEMAMRFADGHVDFPAALNIENRHRLDRAVAAAGDRLGIPVFYRIVSSEGAALPALTGRLAPQGEETPAAPVAAEEGASAWPGAKVVGVTLSPLKFVSTGDGQKYFEGAVLSNGFTIEEIKNGEIVLNNNGRRVRHILGD